MVHPIFANLLKLQQLTLGAQRGPQVRRIIKRIRDSLPERTLLSFDHHLNQHRPAVAVLSESDGCGKCHLKLPRDNALRIRWETDQLHTCPHCGCWLYATQAAMVGQCSPLAKHGLGMRNHVASRNAVGTCSRSHDSPGTVKRAKNSRLNLRRRRNRCGMGRLNAAIF